MLAQVDASRMDAVLPEFHDTVDCSYLVDSELLTEKIQLEKYIVKSKIEITLILTV